MKEKILEIKEVSNIKLSDHKWPEFGGYEIKTDKQLIRLLIDMSEIYSHTGNSTQPGYLWINDIDEFIGAELNDIKVGE